MKAKQDSSSTCSRTTGVVIRSLMQAANAERSQPMMLRPEPLLMLLMMLRWRKPRPSPRRDSRQGLPAGCALVVRYQSR